MQFLDKHRICSPENDRLPLNFMHFKHAMWLCGIPKEQTAQLALKESQLCVRMTFFHNKTAATTKSNSKEFLLQIEKSKCLLVSNRICSLPAQVDQRSVSDPGSALVHFAQSGVGVVSGQSRGGGLWCT